MNDLTNSLPPQIDFSSFDFTNLANSFLPDEKNSPSASEKYLVFFLDEEFYAVASREVAEAALPPMVAVLPNSPEWLVGIAGLRGEIISVINLRKLLNKSASNASPKSKLVVLRSPNSAARFAFTADRLSEIISLRDDEIQFSADETLPFICGQAVHLSNRLNLIDTGKIISSLVIN